MVVSNSLDQKETPVDQVAETILKSSSMLLKNMPCLSSLPILTSANLFPKSAIAIERELLPKSTG